MKKLLNIIYLLIALSLTLLSCKKDEEKLVVKQGTTPEISSLPTNLVLIKETADQDSVVFSWTASSFGYPAAVSYSIEIDKKGGDFSSAKNIEAGNQLQKIFTAAEFNTLLGQMGFPADSAAELDVRVKSEVSDLIEPAYSQVASFTVTPFSEAIVYPSLYVPGAHQGWDPASAPQIFSVNGDQIYTGYVNFPEDNQEFKFTSDPDWNHTNYGDGGNGTLSTEGSAVNLKVGPAGYYYLTADLNTLLWTVEKRVWGVIGSATPTGWDADTEMIYDPNDRKLKVTLNLVPGEIKFRANHAWDLNYGDNTPPDNVVDAGGDNIAVNEAGNYEIILDFTNPAKTTYSINKL